MTNNTEAKPEIYYNTYSGDVFIGSTALEAAIEAGEHPADIFPLAEVLTEDSISIGTNGENFGHPTDLSHEELVSYGKWISGLVTTARPDGWTTDAILQRAYQMGLGPGPRLISNRFGKTLWRFRDAVGETGGWTKQKYDDWTRQEFIEYGNRVLNGLKRKPTSADFHRWYKEGKGPSPSYMRDRLGGINTLQELIGFPDIGSWDEEDYINYGVRFILANPGIKPTARLLDDLSKKKRGPSAKAISLKFDALSEFQELIAERAEEERVFKEAERETKKAEYLLLIEQDEITDKLLDISYKDTQDFIATVARYRTAKTVAPDLSEGELLELCQRKKTSFVNGIVRKTEGLVKPGLIENTALFMGVFDDIWPFDEYLDYLKITKPERKIPAKKEVFSTELGSVTYINLETGDVIEGSNAYNTAITEGTDKEALAPLGFMLANGSEVKNILKKNGVDYKKWPIEANISYGKWISSLVACPDGLPTRDVFRAAYRLGIGPGEGRISALFGNYTNFQALSFFQPEHTQKWGRDAYIRYGNIMQSIVGSKPSIKDLTRWENNQFGPKLEEIVEEFGSIESFYESIGFPDFSAWDKDDFLTWGVQVTEANPKTLVVDKPILTHLYKLKRGPSIAQVADIFGSIENWQEAVTSKYETAQQEKTELLSEQVAIVDKRIADGSLPASLFAPGSPDQAEKIRRTAAYDLIRKLNVKASPDKCGETAAVSSHLFISSLLRLSPNLSPGIVEDHAKDFGIYDIIWPRNEHSEYFKLNKPAQ